MLLSWEKITHKQQVRSQQQGEKKKKKHHEAAAVKFTRHSSGQDQSEHDANPACQVRDSMSCTECLQEQFYVPRVQCSQEHVFPRSYMLPGSYILRDL